MKNTQLLVKVVYQTQSKEGQCSGQILLTCFVQIIVHITQQFKMVCRRQGGSSLVAQCFS